jgi:hypothetical protein
MPTYIINSPPYRPTLLTQQRSGTRPSVTFSLNSCRAGTRPKPCRLAATPRHSVLRDRVLRIPFRVEENSTNPKGPQRTPGGDQAKIRSTSSTSTAVFALTLDLERGILMTKGETCDQSISNDTIGCNRNPGYGDRGARCATNQPDCIRETSRQRV